MTVSLDENWTHAAACAGDPDLWSAASVQARQYAIHVCLEHCDVLAKCRGEAERLEGDRRTHVVVGGISYGSAGAPTLVRAAPRCGQCTTPCPVPHTSFYTAYMAGCRCPGTVQKMRRMWRNRAARVMAK